MAARRSRTTRAERLERLVSEGKVWVEKGAYVGRASDGVVVQLGNVGDESRVERYLTANPNPSRW